MIAGLAFRRDTNTVCTLAASPAYNIGAAVIMFAAIAKIIREARTVIVMRVRVVARGLRHALTLFQIVTRVARCRHTLAKNTRTARPAGNRITPVEMLAAVLNRVFKTVTFIIVLVGILTRCLRHTLAVCQIIPLWFARVCDTDDAFFGFIVSALA